MKASKLKPGMTINLNGYMRKITILNKISEKLVSEATGYTTEVHWIEIKFDDGEVISLDPNDEYDAFIV